MMSVIIDWATLHTWMAKFSRQMCQPSLAGQFRTVQSCCVTFKSSSVARTLRYSCMRCSTSLSHSLGSVGCCRSPLDIERRVNSARSAFTMITYAIYIVRCHSLLSRCNRKLFAIVFVQHCRSRRSRALIFEQFGFMAVAV